MEQATPKLMCLTATASVPKGDVTLRLWSSLPCRPSVQASRTMVRKMPASVRRPERRSVSGIELSLKQMEAKMEESVYQARWLLFTIIVVAGGLMAAGVAAG